MVREWLVDGPHAPFGLALADGSQGLPDGRRVVRIVVVDDDPGRLALAFEATPHAGEGRQATHDRLRVEPDRVGSSRDRHRVRRIVSACGGQADGHRPPATLVINDLQRRARRVLAHDASGEEIGRAHV